MYTFTPKCPGWHNTDGASKRTVSSRTTFIEVVLKKKEKTLWIVSLPHMFTLLFYLLSTRQEINEQKRRNNELNGQLNEERQAREEVLLDNSH